MTRIETLIELSKRVAESCQRRSVRRLVFSDDAVRADLEALTHAAV